ncbi:MAG: gamma-glutamyltransferase family protein [Chloroflexota bacterium]
MDEPRDPADLTAALPDGRPLVPAAAACGASGAVVAPHHLAAAAGLGILRAGGTAVDAAIATNAVLGVIMGSACGLGGDAFWLVWEEASQALVALNGSGRSAAGHVDAVRAAGLDRMPLRGPLTITVPGAVRSWGDAHARWGRLSLGEILAPAIELALGGFPASRGWIASVEDGARAFGVTPGGGAEDGGRGADRGRGRAQPGGLGWASAYRPADRAWRPGERVRLAALAGSLARIADAGCDDFYEGDLAGRQARGLAAAGSPITAADLAEHRSTWAAPITARYRDVVAATHPPNSSGLVALEILRILDRLEPPARDELRSGRGGGAAWAHAGIEAAKLTLADRDAFLTDPEREEVPVERLLSDAHVDRLVGLIDPAHARPPGPSTLPRGGGTVYVAAVDGAGNAVSLIESNYKGFGSGVVDPATGITYQNRGSYFSLDAGRANRLEPSKRTLHTLMPGMLLRDGRPWVVVGSMGGDAQPQIHAQVVSALVDGGLPPEAAVAMPRWFVDPVAHFEPPTIVRIEPRVGRATLDGLEARGHRLDVVDPFWSGVGHCHAIELVDGGPAAGGTLAAATDPRSEGLPAAW